MINKYSILFIFILFFSSSSINFAQGKPYEGPEDPAGDISQLREGYMNGNRVLLYYQNYAQMAHWWSKGVGDSRWPNNYDGTRMIDGSHLIIIGQVFVKNDSIPITSLNQINETDDIDTLYFTQGPGSSGDRNYDNTIGWGFYPVRGYFNEAQDYIAMSNKPDSWPVEGWPSRGIEKKWPGEWNGRFGRGIHYADLECYFAYNDAHDLEYIVKRNDPNESVLTEGPRYYPRGDFKIGDIDPTVTVQRGYPWGGMGLRISTRGFQWNNPEARDIIFWEFDISNISDYDLPVMGFAFDTDLAVGDEHGPDDDLAFFDRYLDMAYAWDYDGIAVGGRTPGSFAFAFLESPGRAYDGVDNDDDGIVDEKRDNPAGAIVAPMFHVSNLEKFLFAYNKKEDDLREHFEGDEDQDWDDGIDLNGDGDYSYFDEEKQLWLIDEGEYAGDDVGLDGVGPTDLNYKGPDEGECNHKPDFLEGFGCEPDFAATDITESDMLGLTTFRFTHSLDRSNFFWEARHDKEFFHFLDSRQFDEYSGGDPNTLDLVFSSSTFPLFKGRTERISQAMLHAYENLSTLIGPGHKAPNLYYLKEIAQVIYESDYRFAQPPLLPTLNATASDGKVILTWNDVSDQLTREPFMGNINDFEGYKLYRATDKLFSDPEIVTNSQGVPLFRSPIFQCDKIDSITGHASYGAVGGAEFYLGNNSGISHYFVDETVQNGKTYYYALVAYDYGIPDIGNGISPAENNIVMELDESEEIIRMGENVVVVTPRQRAAGFQDPTITMIDSNTVGNAAIIPQVFDYEEIKPGHKYKIKFNVDTLGYMKRNIKDRSPLDIVYVNNGLKIYDITDKEVLVYSESAERFPLDNILRRDDRNISYLSGRTEPVIGSFYKSHNIFTDNFDGIQLSMTGLNGYLPIIVGTPMPENGSNSVTTGWVVGSSDINVQPSYFEYYAFPYEYQIVFTNNDSAYVNRLNKTSGIINIERSGDANFLFDQAFSFYVTNQTALDLTGKIDTMELVVEDLNGNGEYDILEDKILVGHAVIRALGSNKLISWGGTVFAFDFKFLSDKSELPTEGDIYRYDFSRPYSEQDFITFQVNGAVEVNKGVLDDSMDDIKVVPNPYVMTNSMEPAVGNKFLNQRRRVMFTHVPAECEIRIYTSSGVFVDNVVVENEPSNGIIHWDLLSREDLEIAAGMYIYHIKSKLTGKEKIGKFAVIK